MSGLLTDRHQLAMAQACLEEGLMDTAVFELSFRQLPPERHFLVAAGLEQALQFLQSFSFSEAEFNWLRDAGGCSEQTLAYARKLRFNGDVDAMPEGTLCFAHEPVLRLTAPLPLALLVESRLLNLIHLETLIASKAARLRCAAGERRLIDFGLRSAHGSEAALLTARAAYLVGFEATATAEAGRRFGIPLLATMTHAYVEAHDSEDAAFRAFAHANPERPHLLIDTYDGAAAAARLVELVRPPTRAGLPIEGVHIEGLDLAARSRAVRGLLNEAGLAEVQILVSGPLDEHAIAGLLQTGAPIDGFCIGTALGAATDVASLDAVYQLQQYAGQPARRRAPQHAADRGAWAGVKQVFRQKGAHGRLERDLMTLADEPGEPVGEPLLQPCLRHGKRVMKPPTMDESRAHHARQLALLPESLRSLHPAETPFRPTASHRLLAHSRKVAGPND